MLNTLFIVTCTGILTLFWGSIAIIVSIFNRTGNLSHLVARMWGRSILFVSRVKVQVQGLSHIDPAKAYIYMPNHLSNFDIPVLLAYLQVQFRWLAKAELFKIPVFGYAMKRAGYISIDRSNRKSAFESLKRTARVLQHGVSVLIFPEGTRSRDGNLGPFKKGGFVTAVESDATIVPVIIHGTWEIMSKTGLRVKPGHVIVEIKPPIETRNYTRKTLPDLMDQVRLAISQSQLDPEERNPWHSE